MSLDPVKFVAAAVVVVLVWGMVAPSQREERRPAAYVPGSRIETGDPPWDFYQNAQKDWQEEVQRLVTQRRPDLAAISAATLDMHWSILDRRAARLRYLLENDPGRIVRDQGYRAFLNFKWVPDVDTPALRTWDPEFSALEDEIKAYSNAAEEHPDYQASRAFLVEELLLDAEYRAVLQRFSDATVELEQMLEDVK